MMREENKSLMIAKGMLNREEPCCQETAVPAV